jgi:thioester reductase-like protein
VNFVSPYSALRHTNVSPVNPLVELAYTGGACKTLHYIGTIAVFNATFRREQRLVHSFDRLLKPDFLYSGYAQTKWVAEACFRVAGSRGIPMGIHRPGLITGASDTGHTNVDDFLCRLVLGCIALGAWPDVEVELDLVGVDDVAEGIAASVRSPTGQGELCIETFHWSHPRPVLIGELMSVYQERGYALRPVPLQDWLGLVRAGLPTTNPLFPVHPFLLEIPEGSDETIFEFMDGLPHTIDRSDADALRAASGLTQRVIDRAAMHQMAAWLERHGHLTPPRNPIVRTS